MRQLSGNTVWQMQHRSAGFYLDECLPHTVAKALRLVRHDIEDSTNAGLKGRNDEDLLTWLQQENRIWITKDSRAREAHRDAISSSGVSIVWIRGMDRKTATESLTNPQTLLLMLAGFLTRIMSEVSASPNPCYFEILPGRTWPRLRHL